MSPQQKQILDYFWKTGKTLTDRDCTLNLNICKLTTRISELRREGWDIPHTKVKNEYNSGYHNVYCMSANDMKRYFNKFCNEVAR